jgi:predicted dehydrogenase
VGRQRLKLAVLGAGDVAQRDYLPEMHRLADRVELVAICARTDGRVQRVAEEYAIPRWFTDHEQMLDEVDADALVNLGPMQLHEETTLAALERGWHVYTEKPAATTVVGVTRIGDAMRRNARIVVCAPSVMVFPQLREARRLLRSGIIGPVYSARGHGHGGVPPWRGFPSDPSQFFVQGGGPAMDMGVYPLHAITGLLGPVQRVSAMTTRVQEVFTVPDGPAQGQQIRLEVDDNWQLCLDLGDARLASVAANNVVQDSLAPQLELHGLAGTIAIDLLDVSEPVQVFDEDGGWRHIAMPGDGRASGPDHLLGIEHLVDCVETGREPILSVDHARHVVEVIEMADASSRAGVVMSIEHGFDHESSVADVGP